MTRTGKRIERPRRDVDVARVAALRAEGPVTGVEWVITMVWRAHPGLNSVSPQRLDEGLELPSAKVQTINR